MDSKSAQLVFFLICVFLIFVSCTSKDERVIAIVNGKQITIKNLKQQVDSKNWNKKFLSDYINTVIEKEIVMYESNRLSMTEDELFSFFEQLKNRQITAEEIRFAKRNEFKDLKESSIKLIEEKIRQKQYDSARKIYIQELKNRSTVRLYLNQLDEGL